MFDISLNIQQVFALLLVALCIYVVVIPKVEYNESNQRFSEWTLYIICIISIMVFTYIITIND